MLLDAMIVEKVEFDIETSENYNKKVFRKTFMIALC